MLSQEARVDAVDQFNCTPLHYAAEAGSIRVVTYLIKVSETMRHTQRRARAEGMYSAQEPIDLINAVSTDRAFVSEYFQSIMTRFYSYFSCMFIMFKKKERTAEDIARAAATDARGAKRSAMEEIATTLQVRLRVSYVSEHARVRACWCCDDAQSSLHFLSLSLSLSTMLIISLFSNTTPCAAHGESALRDGARRRQITTRSL